MIRIVRPDAPAVLLTKGVVATRELCTAYEAFPTEYKSGGETFEFDKSIYAARAVKDALRFAQHKKCAFCESVIDHTSYGDVEHFRPKAGVKQRDDEELKRPGYYWLAYAWDNLFYCCQLCNQRFKRNLFPLKDGRRRARSHKHDLDKEKPCLIDPCNMEPSAYIGFREEYAYAVDGCLEGETTISVLGLNREELAEVRRDRLTKLRMLVECRELIEKHLALDPTPELLERLRSISATLEAGKQSHGEYSAMARALIDGRGRIASPDC